MAAGIGPTCTLPPIGFWSTVVVVAPDRLNNGVAFMVNLGGTTKSEPGRVKDAMGSVTASEIAIDDAEEEEVLCSLAFNAFRVSSEMILLAIFVDDLFVVEEAFFSSSCFLGFGACGSYRDGVLCLLSDIV